MKGNAKAKTPTEYLKGLSKDRRDALYKVRATILKSLPKGYTEVMQYGMISYVVPLKLYPTGYLDDPTVPLPYASLASQKNHMAVYLMNIYGDKKLEKWFWGEYKKTGKRIDAGKSCVRFRKLENLPLSLIGRALAKNSVKEWISRYERSRKISGHGK